MPRRVATFDKAHKPFIARLQFVTLPHEREETRKMAFDSHPRSLAVERRY